MAQSPEAALAAVKEDRLKKHGGLLGVTPGDVAKIKRENKAAGLTDEERIKKDFRLFLTLVWRHLGYSDPTPIQLSMAQYLQYGPDRAVIMAFRGAAKSFITMAFALWTLYVDPQAKVLVVSGSLKRSAAFTFQALALIREMPLLRHLTPGPNQRQSSTMFDVGPARPDQSSSFMAAGITGQIVGFRANLIIGDDVETNTNSLTVDMREKLGHAIKEFDAIIKPDGKIKFLGTPQTSASIYNEMPKRGYAVRIWTARYPTEEKAREYGANLAPYILKRMVGNEGKTTEPTRFSDADLGARELSWGRSGFSLQYMLDTSMSDANKFPLRLRELIVMALDMERGPDAVSWGNNDRLRLDIPFVGGVISGDALYGPASASDAYTKWEEVRAFIDPSGKGDDETTLTIGAKLNGRVFLLWQGGWLDGFGDITLKAIAKALVRWRVGHCRIESNFGGGMFSKLLEPHVTKAWKEYNDKVPHSQHGGTALEEERADRVQKELRIIEVMEPLLNQHRLVVNSEVVIQDYEHVKMLTEGEGSLGEMGDRYGLFSQLTNLTRERDCLAHDDRIDGLAGLVKQWVEELGVDPALMAARTGEEALQEELLKLAGINLDEEDESPSARSSRHQTGRRKSGWQ